jgi:predicted PurR-regulated permease PerM
MIEEQSESKAHEQRATNNEQRATIRNLEVAEERDAQPQRSRRRRRRIGLVRLRADARPRRHFRPPPRRITIWAAGVFGAAGVLLLILAGKAVKAALAVTLLSVFFAYFVAPLARAVRRAAHRRRRPMSTLTALVLVYIACGAGVLIARALIGPRLIAQMTQFTDSVPDHVTRALQLTASLERWQEWFGWSRVSSTALGTFAVSMSDWVRLHVADVLADALDYGWVIPWLGLVPLLSFLLLTQFGTFRRSTLRVLPRGHVRWRGQEFFYQVNSVLAGYVRAQVLSSLIVGSVAAAGMALLQVPYALLVGLAAGVLELVPLLGPVAAALLVAGLVRGPQLLAVLVFLLAIRVMQDAFIYPRLMGRRVHLPPVAVLLAVAIGASTGGILGVLLSIPVVSVAAVGFRQWRDYRQIERLVRAQSGSR